MSTELTPFEKPEYGNLVQLPAKVQRWNTDATKMKAIAEAFKAETDVIDIAKHEDLPAIDKRLENAILKIRGMYERINGERMAETSYLDEIKAYTMRPEKMLADYPGIFKGVRDKIAAEKARRENEKKKQEQDRIEKANELAEIRTEAMLEFSRACLKDINDTKKKMSDAFYAQTLDTIADYEVKLRKYNPKAGELVVNYVPIKRRFYSEGEVKGLFEGYLKVTDMTSDFISAITAERDNFLTLIPSRKRELEEIKKGNSEAEKQAAERKEQEDKKREDDAAEAAINSAQAAESALEIEKLNNAFTTTEPMQSQSKGTQVKKKYQPLTAAAFLPIIQSWVKNDLAGYTVEDLAKKLSFMLTASNARLNKGEKLEAKDLNIVEDYSTRTVKEKEKL